MGRSAIELEKAVVVPVGVGAKDSSRLGIGGVERGVVVENRGKVNGARRGSVDRKQEKPPPPSLPPSLPPSSLHPSFTTRTYMHNSWVAPHAFLSPRMEQEEADLCGMGEVQGVEETIGQELSRGGEGGGRKGGGGGRGVEAPAQGGRENREEASVHHTP